MCWVNKSLIIQSLCNIVIFDLAVKIRISLVFIWIINHRAKGCSHVLSYSVHLQIKAYSNGRSNSVIQPETNPFSKRWLHKTTGEHSWNLLYHVQSLHSKHRFLICLTFLNHRATVHLFKYLYMCAWVTGKLNSNLFQLEQRFVIISHWMPLVRSQTTELTSLTNNVRRQNHWLLT